MKNDYKTMYEILKNSIIKNSEQIGESEDCQVNLMFKENSLTENLKRDCGDCQDCLEKAFVLYEADLLIIK